MRHIISDGDNMKTKRDGSDKGTSPVIGAILMVAVTVILAGIIGVTVLGFQDNVKDPGAVAGMTTEGELDRDVGFPGPATASIIRITHVAGDEVSADEIRIHVDTPGGTFRIDNIPEDGCGNFACGGMVIDDPNNILKSSFNSEHEIPSLFGGGRSIEIAIDEDAAGLGEGKEVTATIVDKESDRIASKNEIEF
jgi:flagellin-like protein